MAGITGFSHLSIQVHDIDKCLPFYTEVLGLVPSVDREQRFSAPDPEGGRTEFHRREVYLRWENQPGAGFVVLGQHLNRAQTGAAARLQQIGFDHVAFYVDDVAGVVRRARAVGVDVMVGPKENDGVSYGYVEGEASIRTALLYDPERNIIQVDQWL